MAESGEPQISGASFAHSALTIVYLTLLLLYSKLVEGLLVQQIYNMSDVIYFEDRFFTIKFVLPIAVFWFSVILIIGVIYLGILT